MKTYFAKYLPVERESNTWQWNNNVQNTGWELITPSDMDAIIAHGLKPAPEFRKVEFFLCSRDIQIGDMVKRECRLLAPAEEWTRMMDNCIPLTDHFKVIGQISPEAIWVKEGDEFDEEDLAFKANLTFQPKVPFFEVLRQYPSHIEKEMDFYVAIKGPCGHFH